MRYRRRLWRSLANAYLIIIVGDDKRFGWPSTGTTAVCCGVKSSDDDKRVYNKTMCFVVRAYYTDIYTSALARTDCFVRVLLFITPWPCESPHSVLGAPGLQRTDLAATMTTILHNYNRFLGRKHRYQRRRWNASRRVVSMYEPFWNILETKRIERQRKRTIYAVR